MVPNPPPLHVVVAADEAPSPTPWLSALMVNTWSLIGACSFVAGDLFYWYHSPGIRATRALVRGMLWCNLLRAVAAALALALLLAHGHRRSRWALGLLAIVAGAATDGMYGGFLGIEIAAHPREVVLIIIDLAGLFLMAAGDLIGFLSLLQGEDEEEDN